ncbi:MAG: DNA polymerase III subunit gamma/tau [Lachnospiraceae bacterium]|nr:DNA polymerase III subunit gamma/tau [Lachnospiraceae bacterium]
MAYVALYRKFRPSDFNEVRGQEHIVKALRNEVKNDRIGHAYLFTGTRGTGKTSLAKIFSKAVNCTNCIDGNPCNECEVCKAINNQTTFDISEIDAASNNGVANVRSIIENIHYAPTLGRFKVFIIDEVHMLSTGAFNALLKTLEEPPAHVIFILATTEVHKIPITILSRCQRYDFRRITADTIAGRIKELVDIEKIDIEEDAIRYLAKAADGSMRDSLSLLEQCLAYYADEKITYDKVLEVLGAVDSSVFSKCYLAVENQDVNGIISVIDYVVNYGRDIVQFVNEFIWYLRNVLIVSEMDNPKGFLDLGKEQYAQLIETAKGANPESVMRYIRVLSKAAVELKYSSEKRVLLEITLIKLMHPEMDEDKGMDNLVERVRALENRAPSEVVVRETVVKAGTEASAGPDNKALQEKLKAIRDAVPEDIKEIVNDWDSIVKGLDVPLNKFILDAKKKLTPDGKLELVFKNDSAYEFVKGNNEQGLEALKKVIEEKKGIRTEIIATINKFEDDTDNPDLSDIINMEINFV